MALPGYNVVVSIATASSGESFSVLDGAINFQIRDFRETLDATDFESGEYRSRVMGLRDVSARISGQLEPADVGYQKLKAAYEAGQPVGFKVLFSSTTGLTLEMLVQSFEWSGSVDGMVDLSVQMVGSGGAGPIETAPTESPVEYVGVGAAIAVTGDLTPQQVAVPAGIQSGDLLLVWISARSTSANLDTPPPGYAHYQTWTSGVSNFNKMSLFWKIADGSETVASVPFTSVVTVPVLIQAAAFRNTHPTTPIAQAGTLVSNPNTVNIASIPGITVDNQHAALVLGHQANDWTSVDTLTGDGLTWVEIGELDTLIGSDAGMVWNYAINGTGGSVAITDKTFVVTGGGQTSIGVMLELANAPV